LLQHEWFIQVLLGFDDDKVLKNNWYTNICSSVQDLLIVAARFSIELFYLFIMCDYIRLCDYLPLCVFYSGLVDSWPRRVF